MEHSENDLYTPVIARIMMIEDVTWGDPQKGLVVRYRGRIYDEDTAAAYEKVSETLRRMDITTLFREENNQHVVLLMRGVITPKPSPAWVNILLFGLTVITVLMAGTMYSLEYSGPLPESLSGLISILLRYLPSGVSFAASLLAILLAHEFGHYLAGRFHRTHVTLPYFIPLPFSLLGTLGAFIQVKEIPRNRRIMLDISIAGPISGLVVAIPLLLLGLSLSEVNPLPTDQPLLLEGNSLLYLGLKYIVKGELLPAPDSYGGLHPALYWLRYIFTGSPLPLGGEDVSMHPIAWAGWAGLLVTALNLIPAGQLDGGHVLYVLMGKRAKQFVPLIILGLVALGFVWNGWWLWAALIFFLGRAHMEPLDQITPLDPRRRFLAFFAVVLFILVFTPVPLIQLSG